ncbi:hypothetical protein [Nocardiopsis potens]|uniref:hypothetical protein n=1 Tax=Nocardiopsis potens TaxID=1246458 RepID=UPI0003624137|nr:hypothetical protein [Nocardiopsis potens]
MSDSAMFHGRTRDLATEVLRLNGALVGRADLLAVDLPRYGTRYWLVERHTGFGQATAACRALYGHAARRPGAFPAFPASGFPWRHQLAKLESSCQT